MARLIPEDQVEPLRDLLRDTDVTKRRLIPRPPSTLPVVKCGALIGATPRPHYDGTLQRVPDLDGPVDASADPSVILAALDGSELTPGTVYHAIEAGRVATVPVFWVEGGSGAAPTDPATSGAWVAGITAASCLLVTVDSVSGLCSGIDPDQALLLTWDGGDSRWESGADFAHDGGSSAVNFGKTNGVPWLTIGGEYGTPMSSDGAGGLLFGFGGAALCTEGADAGCAGNVFVVRVRCASCTEMAGWAGPGWYCIRATGGAGTGYRAELLEGDQYRPDIEIVSGPYADEASALVGCPTGGGGGGAGPGGADCAGATAIALEQSGAGPLPALAGQAWYSLGVLPAGTYYVTVAYPGGSVATALSLIGADCGSVMIYETLAPTDCRAIPVDGTEEAWVYFETQDVSAVGLPYTLAVSATPCPP